MAVNSKQTSPRVASAAGKTLGNESASDLQRSLAGSALRQAGRAAQTSSAMEGKASGALDNPRSAGLTKELAGSLVSQSSRKR